jgi:hypothetical protein
MSARLLALLLLFVQPEQRFLRYMRPVNGGPVSGQKQTCAALDVTAFAHAAPGLADLRLYRDGQEIPYALRVYAQGLAEHASLEVLNLGINRSGEIVFDAEMPQQSYSALQLEVSRKDFIATVNVTGSQTQQASDGTDLGSYTIFDLTGQKLGRSMVLHLPVSDFRFLHFRISAPVKPADVSGLSIEREALQGAAYAMVAESKQMKQQDRDTVIEFSVPPHVPVDRVEFVPAEGVANFSRYVSIEVVPEQEKKANPAAIYSGEIRRVHILRAGRRIDDERLAIDVGNAGEKFTSRWTVRIENGDDLPLALNTVRLEMQKQGICFDAEPGASYTVYYGDAALSPPQYDYARLFQPDKNPAEATLGPEEENQKYEPRPDTRPFTEKHPALLWVALVAAVAILGGIALRSAKAAKTQ